MNCGRVLAGLLLVAAVASGAESSWAKADRAEFLELLRDIEEAGDGVWIAQARRLGKLYDGEAWIEGIRTTSEVHGVALFRGNRVGAGSNPGGAGGATRATVHVTRRGPSVTLLLAAREPINWTIKVGPGARVQRVIFFGNRAQRFTGVHASRVSYGGRSFALSPREEAFSALAAAALPMLNKKPIETFVGRTEPGGKAIEVGPGAAIWRRQMLLRSMRRLHTRATSNRTGWTILAAQNHVVPIVAGVNGRSRVFCDATPEGILADTQAALPRGAFAVAVNPESANRYFLTQTAIVEQDAAGNQLRKIRLPVYLGRRGYAGDVVYDARRRRIIVVSLVGSMASYSLRAQAWEPLGERTNRRVLRFGRGTQFVSAAAWDGGRDCFWTLHARGKIAYLQRYSSSGVRGSVVKCQLTSNLNVGVRNGVELAVVGRHLAIFTPDWRGRRRSVTSICYLIDPDTSKLVRKLKLQTIAAASGPGAQDLPLLWNQLQGPDPYSAIRRLARGGESVVAYLSRRWTAMPLVGEEELGDVLIELDSPSAYIRSHAFARLAGASPAMRTRLEKAIGQQESPEVRMSLRRLLDDFDERPDIVARMRRVLLAIPGTSARELRERLTPGLRK